MPSGSQCVPSMFVSQINCLVSPLCLLLTGWTNDKFSLNQEAVTVDASCLFTSRSPRNNAKRLTINCCHCTLSLVPITCASSQCARTNTHIFWGNGYSRPSLGLMTSTYCKRWTFQQCSISPPGAGGVTSAWKPHYRDESGTCVVRDWPVVLQEVNETISFCCVRAAKHTSPSFVKIACRSATIGDSRGLFFLHTVALKMIF